MPDLKWIMSEFGGWTVLLAALLIYRKHIADAIFHRSENASPGDMVALFERNLEMFLSLDGKMDDLLGLTRDSITVLRDIKTEIVRGNK